jgi:complement component 1 Q subcomponent-binding protein, mitochondrial
VLQVYTELDDNLQKQFEQYLADRGITLDLGAYLLAKVHDKEQKEYTRWLGDVRAFITK